MVLENCIDSEHQKKSVILQGATGGGEGAGPEDEHIYQFSPLARAPWSVVTGRAPRKVYAQASVRV